MLPFLVGLVYHMLLNYPHDNPSNYLVTLTPFVLLRIFLFGALLVSRLARSVLTGQIDRILLSTGSLPIFENYVFAIGTVWNSIQLLHVLPNEGGSGNGDGVNPNSSVMTQEKLVKDLKNLEILTVHPKIRSYCTSFFLIILLLLISQHFITNFFPFSSFIFSFSWGHIFVYTLLSVVFVRDLSVALKNWGKLYYSIIKDQYYLVGMELQNSEEVSQRLFPLFDFDSG